MSRPRGVTFHKKLTQFSLFKAHQYSFYVLENIFISNRHNSHFLRVLIFLHLEQTFHKIRHNYHFLSLLNIQFPTMNMDHLINKPYVN